MWPLEELAALAHEHGAQLFVDAAQLAPHRAIDMDAIGIDHLALSGHKLYAPFGAGALVSRTPLTGDPLIKGGGAVKLVTDDDVIWADGPERFEAGSPNVIGAVALAAACDALDMEQAETRELALAARLHAGLDSDRRPHHLPAVADPPRPRRRRHLQPRRLRPPRARPDGSATSSRSACATAASARTRSSPTCSACPTPRPAASTPSCKAGRDPELPGAVRASLGIGTTAQEVDTLLASLIALQTR